MRILYSDSRPMGTAFVYSTATTTSMTNSDSNNGENYFDKYSKINIPLINEVTHNETHGFP